MKLFHGVLTQPREFRLIRREFVVRENTQAGTTADHCRAHIRPLRQHEIDKISGLLQRIRIDFPGRDNRKTARADTLRVKRRHPVLVRRIESKSLHRHDAGHGNLKIVFLADNRKAVS